MDLQETFPMDFIGAAQSEGKPAIIYISSDEEDHMGCISSGSISDFESEPDEATEEIRVMARCIERQLADPIPYLTPDSSGKHKRDATPRPNRPPFPTFTQRYFNIGNGNDPLACDDRVKSNHPKNVCRNLVPQVDTPLSPPEKDRRPQCSYNTFSSPSPSMANSMETIAGHFDGMALTESSPMIGYSDCVVCGKPVQQIHKETVNDYLDKTLVVGETLAETQARRRAFLDAMNAGTFLLMPGGVSRAAACDGNWHSIGYNYDTLPGTLPIN